MAPMKVKRLARAAGVWVTQPADFHLYATGALFLLRCFDASVRARGRRAKGTL